MEVNGRSAPRTENHGVAGSIPALPRAASCNIVRSYDLLHMCCPAVESLSLLPIERILHVHGPRHRPLRDADVIKHETDRVRVDAKGGHSGGHSATQVVHAEMVKSKFRSGPAKGARGRMRGDRSCS